ncbi:MAG: aminotransferase class I/II-fold pyridoxal phosphate-dependent enzyme [Cyclobacteriaceae bacterium]
MSDQEQIYLTPPSVDEHEEKFVVSALRSGWVAPVGPLISSFEEALRKKFQYRNVLALNSGTAALHLAIKLCNVTEGDKVLVGTFTFVAAANSILYERGTPVFIDSEPSTWNIDPLLLDKRLEEAKSKKERVKAVVVTHIYGRPAQMHMIKSICSKHNVKLIEDAAEAVGSRFKNQFVGSFGDYAVLSFNGNKIITTSGGGALICRDEKDHRRALFLAEQAKEEAGHYQHAVVGFNYRMSNLLAGVGISQLSKLDSFIERKRELFFSYKKKLEILDVFDFPDEEEQSESNYWLSTILIKKTSLDTISPQEVVEVLQTNLIEARRFWKPLHLQPLFEKSEYLGGDVAEDFFTRGICLPCGVGLSDKNQDRVVEALKELIASRALLK